MKFTEPNLFVRMHGHRNDWKRHSSTAQYVHVQSRRGLVKTSFEIKEIHSKIFFMQFRVMLFIHSRMMEKEWSFPYLF